MEIMEIMEIFKEPIADCKVKVGVFTCSREGVKEEMDFCVECEKALTEEDVSRNIDQYNRQLEDEWGSLTDRGYKVLAYKEVSPCPLLFLG